MKVMERLRKIAGVLSPEEPPGIHIIEVHLYRGETEKQGLKRYKKTNQVNVNDHLIYIAIKSDKQIRDGLN